MSCGVGCRHSSDSALLWLWGRPAARAPIRPLAWESPYATGAALEKAKTNKKILLLFLSLFSSFGISVIHTLLFFFLPRATPKAYGDSQFWG